jgi:hypothetical protein
MGLSQMLLILGIIVIVLIAHYHTQNSDMTYVKSNLDGEMYMVRNRIDKQTAANILAQVKANIYKIAYYVNEKITNPTTKKLQRYIEFSPYIRQLNEKIQNVVVMESAGNSVYTSYTINKGEQIIFCIRSKSITNVLNSNNIHDINLIMYVALHEISHVACPEYNHTPLFKKIFRFLCEEAIEMGLYQRIDFMKTPREYCGMKITDTII